MRNIERREFLKTSLIAGATGIVGSPLILKAAEPVKQASSANDTDHDYTAEFFKTIDKEKLEIAVQLAASWLGDIAMIPTEVLPTDTRNFKNYPYSNFKGCVRDSYSPYRSRSLKNDGDHFWTLFGSVWHTGQAVKALSLAGKYFKNAHFIAKAKLGVNFIRDKQIVDKNDSDFGCLVAYEDTELALNTSAILEACDGLFWLTEVTGETDYRQWAIEAVTWAVAKMYQNNGLFLDGYNMNTREIHSLERLKNKDNIIGRPLLDDGILYKTWLYTQNSLFKNTFIQIADKLLEQEEPAGNWMRFQPCNWQEGRIHVRQAFWWGRPLWMAYKLTGQQRYLDGFNRAVEWYIKNMNRDGGITNPVFNDAHAKNTFDTASSGTAAAALMLRDQCAEFGNVQNLGWLITCMKYLMAMQITEAQDTNLKGVVIESIMPPDHTDKCPYWIRDVATTFFVTTGTMILLDHQRLSSN